MRIFDKKKNIQKVNLLAEQKRFKEKGGYSIMEDTDLAYKFLFEEVTELDTEETIDLEFKTTDASFYQVRFNLDKIIDKITEKKIEHTWKIEPNGKKGFLGDDKLNFKANDLIDKVTKGGVRNNFSPLEFNIQMENCVLLNNASKGYAVKCSENKSPFSYIKCSDVKVNYGSQDPGSLEKRLFYNPRRVPYWVMISSTTIFEDTEGDAILIDREENKIGNFEDGVVYESCESVIKGVDDKMPPTKYYYIQSGGSAYVKVVDPSVKSYKGSGEIYKIVDNQSFNKCYTSGFNVYEG